MQGSRQLKAYICLFITFGAAALALLLRLISRRVMKLRLSYDDYLAIVAFLFASAWTGLILWWLQTGLGLFLSDISLPDDVALERSRLILWNGELLYAASLAFSKLAILAFYWRMFKTSQIRAPIRILAGCAILWLVLRTFLAIFHCVPIHKFWKPEVDGVCKINDTEFFFGTVLTHLIIDIAILILPVIEVHKLHLPITQRLGIMAMFLFGIFVCVASVVVLVYSLQYDTSSREMPLNVAHIIIWATVEVNLAIVSACLPMLRPIYLLALRKPLTKNSSSGSHFNPESQPTSHKLATLTTHIEIDKSESDSTHQLARQARQGSISSTSSYNEHGTGTVIVGSAEDRSASPDGRDGRASIGGRLSAMGGILVTNEMTVRVDRVS